MILPRRFMSFHVFSICFYFIRVPDSMKAEIESKCFVQDTEAITLKHPLSFQTTAIACCFGGGCCRSHRWSMLGKKFVVSSPDSDAAFKSQPEVAGAQQISCSSGPTHQRLEESSGQERRRTPLSSRHTAQVQ